MATNLAKALKTDMPRLPLRKMAEELRKKGRGRDTVLAHITPKEAALLKARGGSGTINPDTGLPEFEDFGSTYDFFGGFGGGDIAPSADTTTYADVPLPTARPSDFELSQYNPVTYGAAIPFDQVGSVFSAQVPNVSQGVQAMEIAGVDPTALRYGIDPMSRFLATTTGAPVAAPTVQASGVGAPSTEYQLTPQQQAEVAADLEQQPIDLTTKVPGKTGIETPFGTLGLKEAIAALGLGGMGLSYLNAQAQGKKAAAQLKAAYDQAAAQSKELAAPYMQQGGQQLAQALSGALSPVQQQQLAAGQAQAAQSIASSGGVAAAQAGRSVEDLRQRLLASQQKMALDLLGAGTPLISQAIRDQLAGTTTGINTQLQMSQQAGQAAAGMLGMLGMMYGRG